jgi:hypothetical protein
MKDAAGKIVNFFETLTPQSLARLGEFYRDDATFKDPFSEVQGLAEIEHVYNHMYETLEAPRFEVIHCIVEGQQCFLAWRFKFRFNSFRKQVDQTVRGSSHLTLAADGRIQVHRDYWDAAEELYEKLPVLGSLMRWLKKRASS